MDVFNPRTLTPYFKTIPADSQNYIWWLAEDSINIDNKTIRISVSSYILIFKYPLQQLSQVFDKIPNDKTLG